MQFLLALEQIDFKSLFQYEVFDKHMVFLSGHFV